MRGRALALFLAAGALILACATRGARFNVDAVAKIRPGVTTQAEVRRWFGQPVGVRVNASGTTRWRYLYEESERRDTGTLTKIGRSVASVFGLRVFVPPVDVAWENTTRHELDVLFGPQGVVEDYAYDRRDTPSRRVY